ncbi:MAG: hypothetical protein ACP5XB_02305 [Isosphaeraceae bacterium]
MNADLMIDYVLGRLDGSDRDRVAEAISSDPELTARAERLGQVLNLLLDDGETYEPSPDLTRRTLALVAASRSRPRTFFDYAPVRVPFHWADLAVAASIFIAGLLTLIPAVERSRERMSQAGCTFNLQQLGHSLAQYASIHPSYPYPPDHLPDAHAGTFPVFLHDAGVLQDLSILDCPYNGPHTRRQRELPSFAELERLRTTEPTVYRQLIDWDYAFNVGYRHRSGSVGPLESSLPLAVPVVADQPAHENYQRILAGNSPNHAGRGQNALFSDGSVRWLPTRRVSPIDLDLFLNNQLQPEPGLNEGDSVLLPSLIPFHGTNPH